MPKYKPYNYHQTTLVSVDQYVLALRSSFPLSNEPLYKGDHEQEEASRYR